MRVETYIRNMLKQNKIKKYKKSFEEIKKLVQILEQME